MAKPAPAPRTARIFKAIRWNLGKVIRGLDITEAEAVDERRAGRDIVVCDGTGKDNKRLAGRIENAVGLAMRQSPHISAGPYALPHFQQVVQPPEGHSFYETDNKKTARNP